MVAYAALNNFFPIVAQRFNRPRIRHYLELATQNSKLVFTSSKTAETRLKLASSNLH